MHGRFLAGSQDYYSHVNCDIYNKTNECGVDMHYSDPYKMDRSQNGTYSAHLFTQKAIDIIANQDKGKAF